MLIFAPREGNHDPRRGEDPKAVPVASRSRGYVHTRKAELGAPPSLVSYSTIRKRIDACYISGRELNSNHLNNGLKVRSGRQACNAREGENLIIEICISTYLHLKDRLCKLVSRLVGVQGLHMQKGRLTYSVHTPPLLLLVC